MTLLQLVVIAVVQGLTEFLPVSSSGHLVLVPALTCWPDQGLAIDVAAHIGTLVAVVAYFWRDFAAMLTGFVGAAKGQVDGGLRLAGNLLIGTVPALIIGFVVDRWIGEGLRHMQVVAWTMIGFAFVLYLADRYGATHRRIEQIGWRHALIIGLAQCLAFVPGTSRSGITMVAARALGYSRADGARFSFLLSVPAIAAAGLWKGYELVRNNGADALGDAFWTMALSALAGFAAIAFLMRWLARFTFTPFVIYRLGLGALLLYFAYGAGSLCG